MNTNLSDMQLLLADRSVRNSTDILTRGITFGIESYDGERRGYVTEGGSHARESQRVQRARQAVFAAGA